MQLKIVTPSSWKRSENNGRQIAIVPVEAEESNLIFEWGVVDLLPDEQRPWIDAIVHADLPAPASRVEIAREETISTHAGWPLRLVEAHVRGDDDAIIEYRLIGFFAFLEHAATACLRGRHGHHFENKKLTIRELLIGAVPDWSDEPCSLEELLGEL